METSASFEARYAPLSYPTEGREHRVSMPGLSPTRREEFVGSCLYQVHLYRCLESNVTGSSSHATMHIYTYKRLDGCLPICPIVSVNFEAKRNFCAAQPPLLPKRIFRLSLTLTL